MTNRSFFLFIVIATLLSVHAGCRPGERSSEPTRPNPPDSKQPSTAEVKVGGKVWRINPDLSYRATGIWTNPNPRPLTEAEKKRLGTLPDLIDELKTQLDALNKERAYLERIERKQIKVHYNFGKPPYLRSRTPNSPPDFDNVIDLGEFPIEIEPYTPPTTSEEKP
ncbi:hypothetical protein C6501_14850 [Candidatus Poribacteria bacterium]|nr:MAG: hypothetical protein C6501_14850 [Candidatus Poribacteria bacterium]